MAQAADLPGAAHLELADGVVHLDPKPALLEAMLAGWARQQQTRFLNEEATVKPRVALVRRFVEFTNAYPWEWRPADAEAFVTRLRSPNGRKPIAMSTGRGYETTLALFMDYLTDRRYGWLEVCLERFGDIPQQIFHEDNRVAHVADYEGRPGRRPLTYDEVQALFDAVDGRVEQARTRGRKGAMTAMRDAALLKTVYAFGLRRNESRMLDLADLRRAQKAPQYRQYGGLLVRYGKASRGSPPKRRTVLTVPEMDWIVDVLDQWVTEIRPLFAPGKHPALFVTERAGRMSLRGLNVAFSQASEAASLAPELDLHSLRHSYITHLVEFDYPERFVSLQAGHEYASTTAIYTNPRELHQPGEIREVCPGTKGCNEVPAARHDSFVTWDYARTSPPDARFPRQPGKIMRTAGPSRARPTCPGPARAHGANPRVRRPGRLEEHQRGDASGPAGADQLRAFRGLEYPSPPLGISDEYRDRLVKRALKNRNPNLWEAQ